MNYQLYREQHLNCNIKEAWEFFSSPKNLSLITPKDLGLTVLTKFEDNEIYEGMIINYKVSPLLNIPLKWQTRIIQVDYQRSFTDFQEKGPYKYWNHFHEFIPKSQGVLMKDTVDYELPLGVLGVFAHNIFIKNKLKSIFEYRFNILEKIFNSNLN